MRDVVILDAVRTPVGRYAGALRSVRPDDLAAHVIQAIVRRHTLDPGVIEDVVMGCANQAGEDNRNVARMAALLAGLPVEVPGQTVNRLCGSGMQAVHTAAHAIACGLGDVYIAGGVESMTRAPYVLGSPEEAFPRGPMVLQDTTIGWRFPNPKLAEIYPLYSMGETAENVAERYGISRDDQDLFAWESQQRAALAVREGRFAEEIVPV
ncbi:MAG TPA: beta-ketoacyl synthase N-terminal-like domain-containing protein, partial [bacterium]|nr:beta-ketoacyl synthase N-terminal-like domain-containing protein [bacterium]